MGDRIQVSGAIFLPAKKTRDNNSSLKDKFIWGHRISLMGEKLFSYWGEAKKGFKYRYKKMVFNGVRWDDLFQEAEESLTAEVEKITDAEEKRRQSLRNAE